jgi:hypothetical protein
VLTIQQEAARSAVRPKLAGGNRKAAKAKLLECATDLKRPKIEVLNMLLSETA